MRLDKYLADCGIASRSESKKLIKSGNVQVAGIHNLRPETQIDPEAVAVTVRGVPVRYRRFVYLMLNKPQGYLSSTRDGRQPIVLDLVPEEFRHFDLFPAGRLDIDTEGLCLLTNDGQLAHRILSPARHIPKTYYAKIKGKVTPEDVQHFSQGVILDDGYLTKPAQLEVLTYGEVSEIALTITEGKFHQVKRMFLAVGKEVIYLKRIRMNRLELDPALPLGKMRELTEEEISRLEG
ncbi:MAG: rRNA pseudouridine synthase [Clostridia bacterium]|nr:rRNA pseudouridine synthase [Clostridia bacterium]